MSSSTVCCSPKFIVCLYFPVQTCTDSNTLNPCQVKINPISIQLNKIIKICYEINVIPKCIAPIRNVI